MSRRREQQLFPGAPAAVGDTSHPRRLSTLLAMLHTQNGDDNGVGAARHTAANPALQRFAWKGGFPGLGLAAAAATADGKWRNNLASPEKQQQGLASHALSSPGIGSGSSSYQPASPQRQEGTSPARRAARARLIGFPLLGGSSMTPSYASGEEEEAPAHASLAAHLLQGESADAAQTIAQLRAALAAAEGDARVAAWARDAAERRAVAAEAAAKAAAAAARSLRTESSGMSTTGEPRSDAASPQPMPGDCSPAATASPAFSFGLAAAAGSPDGGSSAGSLQTRFNSVAQPAADATSPPGSDASAPRLTERRLDFDVAAGSRVSAPPPPPQQQQQQEAQRIAELEAQVKAARLELDAQLEFQGQMALHAQMASQQESIDIPAGVASRIAELQTQLLTSGAAADAAERRAELAERQKEESQRLLVALQAALLQSALASAAGTPIHSPRQTPRSVSPASRGHRYTPVSGGGSTIRRVSSGASVGSFGNLSRLAAPAGDADADALAAGEAGSTAAEAATIIATLREDLDAARAELAVVRQVAERASDPNAPGTGELWRKLLEAEAEARAAAAAAAASGHARSGGTDSEGPAGGAPRLMGEVWRQLGASLAEREALQRTSTATQRQLSELRERSASANSGDLSRAFAAAAASAPGQDDLPPSQATIIPAGKPARLGSRTSFLLPDSAAAAAAAHTDASPAAASFDSPRNTQPQPQRRQQRSPPPAAASFWREIERQASPAASSTSTPTKPSRNSAAAAAAAAGGAAEGQQPSAKAPPPPGAPAADFSAAPGSQRSRSGNSPAAGSNTSTSQSISGTVLRTAAALLWGHLASPHAASGPPDANVSSDGSQSVDAAFLAGLPAALRMLAARLLALPTLVRLLILRALSQRALQGSRLSTDAAAPAFAGGGMQTAGGAAGGSGSGASGRDPTEGTRQCPAAVAAADSNGNSGGEASTDDKPDQEADRPAAGRVAALVSSLEASPAGSSSDARSSRSESPGAASTNAGGSGTGGSKTSFGDAKPPQLQPNVAAAAAGALPPTATTTADNEQSTSRVAELTKQWEARQSAWPQLGSMMRPESSLGQATLIGASVTAAGAVAAWWLLPQWRRRVRLPLLG